jgi:uncharacterized protein
MDGSGVAAALKASEFNHFVPAALDGTVIAYNAFTGAYLPMAQEDFIEFAQAVRRPGEASEEMRAALKAKGFLVEESRDERAELKAAYGESRAAPVGLNLTIAPTVSCNFACSYCFEEHPKRHLSDADIEAMAAHVAGRLKPGEPLNVTWFGGEPLAAFPALEKLDAALQAIADERGSPYTQFIITNGSLLDERKIAYFAGRPGFTGAQITLDGPPEIHDQRRYSSAGKPTFAKILDNLKAVDGRFQVQLRVNLDRTNVEAAPRLIELIGEAGIADWTAIYFGHVVDYTAACGDLNESMLSRRDFAAAEVALFHGMVRLGLRPAMGLPEPDAGSLCVGDAPNGGVLSPGGLFFKCWNETALPEGQAYGRLNADGSMAENATREDRAGFWRDYGPFSHAECSTCSVQPLCKGGCPWEAEKMPEDGPGACTPLRFNLAERLQLHHLVQSIDAAGRTPRADTPGPKQVV